MTIEQKQKPLAIITGGTKGVGSAYAMAFAKKGYDLLLIDTSLPEETNFLIDELKKRYKNEITVLKSDLSTSHDLANLCAYLKKEDKAQAFVHCAGYVLNEDFLESSVALQTDMFHAGCTALVDLSRVIIPILKEKDKSLFIALANISAIRPTPKKVLESAISGFTKSFIESLSLEFFNTSITFQVVLADYIKTHHACDNLNDQEYLFNELKLSSWQEPEDIVIKSIKDSIKNELICIANTTSKKSLQFYKLFPKQYKKNISQKIKNISQKIKYSSQKISKEKSSRSEENHIQK